MNLTNLGAGAQSWGLTFLRSAHLRSFFASAL
jgi:hypothetical protein